MPRSRSDGPKPSARPKPRTQDHAPGASARVPTFRSLTPSECDAILARNHVGRLAYTLHNRVDVEPLHYIYDDGWLYGRTSHGAKIATLAHQPWVAFEVDEIQGPFDWRSVVVHGAFYRLDPDRGAPDHAAWRRAVEVLSEVLPTTLTPEDPVPFRTVLFRIHADEIAGRAAESHPLPSPSGALP